MSLPAKESLFFIIKQLFVVQDHGHKGEAAVEKDTIQAVKATANSQSLLLSTSLSFSAFKGPYTFDNLPTVTHGDACGAFFSYFSISH